MHHRIVDAHGPAFRKGIVFKALYAVGKAGAQTFPRLGAFCEVAWSEKETKDYARFLEKLPAYERLLQTLPVPYTARRQANPRALKKLLLSLREGGNWVRGALQR